MSFRPLLLAMLLSGSGVLSAQTKLFFRQLRAPLMEQVVGVASDRSGIYVAATAFPRLEAGGAAAIWKYDRDGNELWRKDVAPFPSQIVADDTGVYVLTRLSEPTGNTGGFTISSYGTDGTVLWTNHLGAVSAEMSISSSSIYVAVLASLPERSFIRKYSVSGTELWTTPMDSDAVYRPARIAADETGAYVLGSYDNAAGLQPRFLSRYSSAGVKQWTRTLFDSFYSIPKLAAAPDGLYLAGLGFGRLFLVKYGPSGNTPLWSRQIGTWNDVAPVPEVSLAVDAGDVYSVSGNNPFNTLPGLCRSGLAGDAFIRKFDGTGAELWSRQFGTADGAHGTGVAVDQTGVYVVGREGSAEFLNDIGLLDLVPQAGSSTNAFLAKFAKPLEPANGSRIFPDCIVNAASYIGGGVAPGEIVTIFGAGIGPREPMTHMMTGDDKIPTELGETRILFDGTPGRMLYASETQSTVITPWAVQAGNSVEVLVEHKGTSSPGVRVPVLAARPGIFSADGSGRGQALILNEDRSANSAANPAARGSLITIYATGAGESAEGWEDERVTSNAAGRTPLPLSVTFDLFATSRSLSRPAEITSIGPASGLLPGVLQIVVRVPVDTFFTGSNVPFLLTVGPHWTVGQVTVALR